MDHVVDYGNSAFKNTADDALLPPDLSFSQLSVSKEAGEFGARAGAARRAIISFTWTKNKVFAVHAR